MVNINWLGLALIGSVSAENSYYGGTGTEATAGTERTVTTTTPDRTCYTEEECDIQRQLLHINRFYVGDWSPTYGCFVKNGVAYWGTGGNRRQVRRSNLSGFKVRILCDGETAPSKSPSESPTKFPSWFPTESPSKSPAWKDDGWKPDGWQPDGWQPDGWQPDGWQPDGWGSDGHKPTDTPTLSPTSKPTPTPTTTPTASPTTSPTTSPTASPTASPVWKNDGWQPDGWQPDGWGGDAHNEYCLSRAACNEARLKQGFVNLIIGNFGIKGCFQKNGEAYWGKNGSQAEMTRELSGRKERIYCNMGWRSDGWSNDGHTPDPTPSPTPSPTDSPTDSPVWQDDGWQADGWFDDGWWKDDGWNGDGHEPCFEANMSPSNAGVYRYPDLNGRVRVCFDGALSSTSGSLYMRVFNLGMYTIGGVHIHSGTSCDDQGGHYFRENSDRPNNGDPWFPEPTSIAPAGTLYTTYGNSEGTGHANFRFDSGYGAADNVGHVIVIHDTLTEEGGDYARVACGLLVAV